MRLVMWPTDRWAAYSTPMPVELTPAGTRGAPNWQPPAWLKGLVGLAQPLFDLFMGRRMRLLKLTTVGARSGNEHRVSLFCAPAGPDAWYVVASAGGAIKHPAWYYNMARNPDRIWIELDGRRVRVAAATVTGAERDAAWRAFVAKWPGYADYQARTDRVIPVVKLTPV
jgi:deazaflavin-dependent oxidoreductase (nitroreductase family)